MAQAVYVIGNILFARRYHALLRTIPRWGTYPVKKGLIIVHCHEKDIKVYTRFLLIRHNEMKQGP